MKKAIITIAIIVIALGIAGGALIYFKQPEYAYTPSSDSVLNSHQKRNGYDIWGQHVAKQGGQTPLNTAEENQQLSRETGAIKIDNDLLELGKDVFYKETFGNEVFLTDIVGVVDGPFTIQNMMKALVKLGGKGTNNLKVKLAKDATIGGKTFHKGEMIDTGIDVPKGAYTPLGMPIKATASGLKVGISCAACHATVDRKTKRIIEGAPNSDLNTGLILALATNSSAYFTHAQIQSLENYVSETSQTVTNSEGNKTRLPDPKALENAVDKTLLKWPRGNFDSTIDLKGNPSQIPDSFSLGDFPYGWSGFAMAGPFHGLSTFSTNVHAQNADSLSQVQASEALFGIDPEVYLGTILQNASNPKYRYDAKKDSNKPTKFLASVDPTPGTPGVNELVKSPTFPKISLVAPDSLIASSPGYPFNRQNNAVAAWQNTIVPPKPAKDVDPTAVAQGRNVFVKAGCISCHAGRYLTNNRIVSAKKIGTEPSRAKALKKTENIFTNQSQLYAPGTPVPIPDSAKVLNVPTDKIDPAQVKLGFAHGNSPGGYKTPSLIGLYWTAPYLHDGGVAVGPNIQTQLGLPRTVMEGVLPNPENSLRALVDKNLRQKVIAANKKSKQLQSVHATGQGHEFWVDETTGFTKKQQDALIDYLLSLNGGSKSTAGK